MMEEIKINVSIKVWIYIILAVAACFAIIMGISRAVGKARRNLSSLMFS